MEGHNISAIGQAGALAGGATVAPVSAEAAKAATEDGQVPHAPHPDNLTYLVNHDGTSAKQYEQTVAKYTVDPKTHEVQVQIVDATTGEVVREIPLHLLAEIADSLKMYQSVLLERRA